MNQRFPSAGLAPLGIRETTDRAARFAPTKPGATGPRGLGTDLAPARSDGHTTSSFA